MSEKQNYYAMLITTGQSDHVWQMSLHVAAGRKPSLDWGCKYFVFIGEFDKEHQPRMVQRHADKYLDDTIQLSDGTLFVTKQEMFNAYMMMKKLSSK